MTQAALLSTADVARRVGVTPAAVRQWERLGKLKATRTAGGIRLFREADVVRFLAVRTQALHAKATEP